MHNDFSLKIKKIDRKFYHRLRILMHPEVTTIDYELDIFNRIFFYFFIIHVILLLSEHVNDPKQSALSKIMVFLLMLMGALALIACVVIGIMWYQKHQENSRKRFY